jgi:CheY-like chemotaxis protein
MISLGKVLLLDDDEVSTFISAQLLQEMRVAKQVLSETDVPKALELVEKEPLDVILLDINMPISNGFEFLDSLIQLQENKGAALPSIVMLTSSVSSTDKARAKQYPMVKGYLSKPLTEGDVYYLISLISEDPK